LALLSFHSTINNNIQKKGFRRSTALLFVSSHPPLFEEEESFLSFFFVPSFSPASPLSVFRPGTRVPSFFERVRGLKRESRELK
jgi:hypothetical protein